MSKVEILLATMHRENTDFLKAMNIQTDVVAANQADSFSYSESVDGSGNKVRFITTAFRGLSKNRNLLFAYAADDIMIFADDDMRYVDGYEAIILRAFDEIKDADLIVFNINEVNTTRANTPKITSVKRVGITDFSRYGSYSIAMRRSSVIRSRICMSEIYGSGSGIYSCGEDSIFLRDTLRKGLKIYAYPGTIADVDQTGSKWFKGYDEKFMFDKGAVCRALFPFLWRVFIWHFILKFSRVSELSFNKCALLMFKGARLSLSGISYDEYVRKKKKR